MSKGKMFSRRVNIRLLISAVIIKHKLNLSDRDNNESPSPGTGNGSSEEMKPHQGKLIMDATVEPQAIRYPTDLSMLNEARELTELIIDKLHAQADFKKKPQIYSRKARQAYLAIAKQKRPSAKVRRRGIK
jgi:hypothetical protein